MYTTKHAQRLYNVKSDQTIRNWIKEFQEFFSANTAPGKGVDVQLTDEDMQVLSLIASMRVERRPAQDIYATLKSGQRGELPQYTPEEMEALVKGDIEQYLSTQLNELNYQIAELTDKLEQANRDVERMREALQPEREARIRAETERTALERRLEDMTSEVQEMRRRYEAQVQDERERNEKLMEKYLREIAELRYKMGQLEKRDDKADD
jgi:septal ring factor EnvC (AmiA/AmiB activator)